MTDAESVTEWLRSLERRYPRKHSTRWVPIPRCIVLGTPTREEHDECIACGLAEITQMRGPTAVVHRLRRGRSQTLAEITQMRGPTAVQITDEDRRAFSHGLGIPLKVLLTLYRWARPYANTPSGAPPDCYVHQAIASLPIKRLADESIRGRYYPWLGSDRLQETKHLRRESIRGRARAGRDGTDITDIAEALERRARRAVRKLKELRLIEVVTDPGRGRANFYAPHRLGSPMRVPSGLWRNGWMGRLNGPALLLLLVLLGQQPALVAEVYEWRRTPHGLRALAERGRLLVDALAAKDLPVSENPAREALNQLKQFGLVTEVRTREHRFIVLLDPELLQPAPQDGPLPGERAHLKRWIANLPISEKDGLLMRLAQSTEARLSTELLRRFRQAEAP